MRPHGTPTLARIYAIIALLAGAYFLIVTPPFGTGDETAHFERSYEIASLQFLGADGLPSGMQRFLDDAFGTVKSGEAVRAADYARWSEIPLARDEMAPYPEPVRKVMRLHSPFCYLHFAPVVAAGLALDAPPFWIFYAGRIAALFCGVALISAGIARAPRMIRPAMVFLALLPTALVYGSAFNIESLLIGLGFYYFALVASLVADADQPLARRDIVKLALVGALLGQFKTGYLLLPALALVIPATRFSSLASRTSILALIILPGAAMSLGWAFVVKNAMLGDLVYSTMSGNHVEPSAQLAGVLADPLGYAAVVVRTIVATDAPASAWRSFLALGGWSNIPVPAVVLALLTVGFFAVLLGGAPAPAALTRPQARLTQAGIVGATTLAILTLVYFQWNGVGAPVIEGFQGRYFLAFAPMIIALAPLRLSLLAAPERQIAAAIGVPVIGILSMGAAVADRYW